MTLVGSFLGSPWRLGVFCGIMAIGSIFALFEIPAILRILVPLNLLFYTNTSSISLDMWSGCWRPFTLQLPASKPIHKPWHRRCGNTNKKPTQLEAPLPARVPRPAFDLIEHEILVGERDLRRARYASTIRRTELFPRNACQEACQAFVRWGRVTKRPKTQISTATDSEHF
jgi:hypothetical protein